MGSMDGAGAHTSSTEYQTAENGPNDISTLGLTHDAIALYKYAVANPGWTHKDVSGSIGLDRARLSDAVNALQINRLFQRSVDPDRMWDAVGPKSALADLMMGEETKLRHAQLTLLKTQEELMSLVPSYLDALQRREQVEPVNVFHGDVTVHRLLAELARKSINELCVANSGHGDDDIRWVQDLRSEIADLPRKVNVRFLLDRSAQARPVNRRRLGKLSQSGWDIRTVHFVPFQLIIVDDSATFLPMPAGPRGTDVTVVRHPAVVESFRTAFERSWNVARPLVADGRPGQGLLRDQLRVDILHHLEGGKKDEVIARQLGLSVRTCRRHIAAIMEELGATGRFQAGVLAQRLIFDNERDAPSGCA